MLVYVMPVDGSVFDFPYNIKQVQKPVYLVFLVNKEDKVAVY